MTLASTETRCDIRCTYTLTVLGYEKGHTTGGSWAILKVGLKETTRVRYLEIESSVTAWGKFQVTFLFRKKGN